MSKCHHFNYVSEASRAMTIRMLRLPNSVKHLDTEEVERIAQVIYEQSIL